ncbi:MAG TPA: 2-C-methyl-D-erythritol 4-phosphate cytidylyltransferase [Solirubrobacteraceae bacterium]|jgi:2-C-methyl-D-erythritol 4-phosphate cytidylyltransferase|nr:2-C-methyl-D-erythritol 4-phosphate cytidylyltransferase [Solirubrobacteraceae bacterium]
MTIALIVAAGSGERLRADRPKALVQLAGRPMLQWSIDALAAMAEVQRIVVALPPGTQAPAGVVGVQGGATRSDSVRRALDVAGDGDPVIVHDAARPMLTPALAREVTGALGQDEHAAAAIAAAPVSDTIKRVDGDGVVIETLARAGLWAVQTPQVFRRDALERALDVSEDVLAAATDDAWLVERSGGRVIVVDVGAENLKVTTPLDLELADMLLARRLSGLNPA